MQKHHGGYFRIYPKEYSYSILTFRWVCEELVLVIGLLSPNH
jgi:hypothetical protein